jgi:hypothetical protein
MATKKAKKPTFPKTIYVYKDYTVLEISNSLQEALENGFKVIAEYELKGVKKLVVTTEEL